MTNHLASGGESPVLATPRPTGLAMTLSRHPDVVCMNVSGGAVLLHTRDEIYYGLNSVGVRIWELLRPDVRDLDELCAALALDYPDVDRDTLRADVAELLESLRSSGLVVADAP